MAEVGQGHGIVPDAAAGEQARGGPRWFLRITAAPTHPACIEATSRLEAGRRCPTILLQNLPCSVSLAYYAQPCTCHICLCARLFEP